MFRQFVTIDVNFEFLLRMLALENGVNYTIVDTGNKGGKLPKSRGKVKAIGAYKPSITTGKSTRREATGTFTSKVNK